jgi:hypothetical protein
MRSFIHGYPDRLSATVAIGVDLTIETINICCRSQESRIEDSLVTNYDLLVKLGIQLLDRDKTLFREEDRIAAED